MAEMLAFSRNVCDTRCPTRHVLTVIGDKWAAPVVGLLGTETLRFTELQRQIKGISQKMLTQTLRSLERDGLVQRTVYAEVPPRVEYTLTPLGQTLYAEILALKQWSDANARDIIAAQQLYDTQATNRQ